MQASSKGLASRTSLGWAACLLHGHSRFVRLTEAIINWQPSTARRVRVNHVDGCIGDYCSDANDLHHQHTAGVPDDDTTRWTGTLQSSTTAFVARARMKMLGRAIYNLMFADASRALWL